MTHTSEAQTKFSEQYITASEIARECEVTRTAVLHARRRGDLPEPIAVGEDRIYIWERSKIRSFIDTWKRSIATRKGLAT